MYDTRMNSLPIALKRNTLHWLMELYSENYQRLLHIAAPTEFAVGRYVSRLPNKIDLHLEIIAHHAYTVEMHLTYPIIDAQSGLPDPSAYLRVYRDSQQAEVTHCYAGRRWQDVLGLHPDNAIIVSHRLRMNTFLNKWLEYLEQQGHCTENFIPA